MKKGITLTIVVLVSLPSCRGPKKKREPQELATEKEVDIFSSVNIPLAETTENETNIALDGTNEVNCFFDEQTEEFKPVEKFSWIEADEEFRRVYFDWDSFEVDDKQVESVSYDIQQVQEELKVSKKTGIEPAIVIEGHACHSAGSLAYNLALSEKRAKKVADRFIDAGINQGYIKVVGRGQDVPVLFNNEKVTGSREEQWLNRRVEVRVIYS